MLTFLLTKTQYILVSRWNYFKGVYKGIKKSLDLDWEIIPERKGPQQAVAGYEKAKDIFIPKIVRYQHYLQTELRKVFH
ncbi:hypothetical protein HOLleu_18350 [Holothuria leucospilota]|uniref:Uncharacterized protein n=1 Tax=Holothuria leucospilota TaxID=206669 RepID=A0A9Q1C3P2_HOLLE|nr:hypothetical protein HOLleu_18350 [Holothuria leucospilota]